MRRAARKAQLHWLFHCLLRKTVAPLQELSAILACVLHPAFDREALPQPGELCGIGAAGLAHGEGFSGSQSSCSRKFTTIPADGERLSSTMYGDSYTASFSILVASSQAAASGAKIPLPELANTDADPPASSMTASRSSTSGSMAYGCVSPLSP